MSKRKNNVAVPTSVGIATPQYGVRTGIGAVCEQFVNALRRRKIDVGVTNDPAAVGYSKPPEKIESAHVISFESPFFWRGRRPIGVITDSRSEYDGSYILPLKDASKILCPSTWAREMVAARQKAYVWRFGIDDAFIPMTKERGDKLRILHFAAKNDVYRKGTALAVSAFLRAFPSRRDVELALHSTSPSSFERNNNRVVQDFGPRTPTALAEFYRSFDVMIYSSRSEAFASAAIEAMACGVPVIHTGATGMADIADFGLTVPARIIRANDGSGTWAEPDVPSIAERLLEVDTEHDRIQAQAFEQAQSVRNRFRWDSAVDTFLRYL